MIDVVHSPVLTDWFMTNMENTANHQLMKMITWESVFKPRAINPKQGKISVESGVQVEDIGVREC